MPLPVEFTDEQVMARFKRTRNVLNVVHEAAAAAMETIGSVNTELLNQKFAAGQAQRLTEVLEWLDAELLDGLGVHTPSKLAAHFAEPSQPKET